MNVDATCYANRWHQHTTQYNIRENSILYNLINDTRGTMSDKMTTYPIKKRQRLSPHEREHQIVKGAIDFVSDRGLNFSTRELANHLKISQSLLYRYFSHKDDIVEKIYERVYLGRWDPVWDETILDRSNSIEYRLKIYFKEYTKVILQKDWIRIFLLSAFDNPLISQRYIALLRKRIFQPLLDEQLVELNLPNLTDPAKKEMALELLWGFHSSFFYLGVRQWVFKVPTQVELDALIECRVNVFLPGFREFLKTSFKS